MKKLICTLSMFMLLYSNVANAQADVSYHDEMQALGIIAGQGMACEAKKYETFEMLARAILITKAKSDDMQARGMEIYNEEKANTYVSKQFDGFYDCKNIARKFDRQDIFKMKLYGDGTIKMPDGQIYTPRNPYDATLIYKKGGNDKEDANKIYNKKSNQKIGKREIQVEGIDVSREKPKQLQQQPVKKAPTTNKPKAQESSVGRISRKNKR